MGYVLAAIVICAIAFVIWRLVALRDDSSSTQRVPDRRRAQPPKGPDDDPDFLNTL